MASHIDIERLAEALKGSAWIQDFKRYSTYTNTENSFHSAWDISATASVTTSIEDLVRKYMTTGRCDITAGSYLTTNAPAKKQDIIDTSAVSEFLNGIEVISDNG